MNHPMGKDSLEKKKTDLKDISPKISVQILLPFENQILTWTFPKTSPLLNHF